MTQLEDETCSLTMGNPVLEATGKPAVLPTVVRQTRADGEAERHGSREGRAAKVPLLPPPPAAATSERRTDGEWERFDTLVSDHRVIPQFSVTPLSLARGCIHHLELLQHVQLVVGHTSTCPASPYTAPVSLSLTNTPPPAQRSLATHSRSPPRATLAGATRGRCDGGGGEAHVPARAAAPGASEQQRASGALRVAGTPTRRVG